VGLLRTIKKKEDRREIERVVENAVGLTFNCYLAVRRTGAIRFGERGGGLLEAAQARAYEVAAFLTLAFLAISPRGDTCGLACQVPGDGHFTFAIEQGKGFVMLQAGPAARVSWIVNWRREPVVSRDELSELPRRPELRGLAKAMLPQRRRLAASLRRAIVQSALRLCDGIHSSTESAQLLGSVTSIEILVGDPGLSYDATLRRMQALVGTEILDECDAAAVLAARHAYVHRGTEPRRKTIPRQAVALAFSCLLRFAELAQLFTSRELLQRHLELVYSGQKLLPHWTPREKAAFDLLSRQPGSAFRPPFLTQGA
jgi:hypothetical protein